MGKFLFAVMFTVAALLLLPGCFIAPAEVQRGHQAAAQMVQGMAANEALIHARMRQALLAERKSHIEYATAKALEKLKTLTGDATATEAAGIIARRDQQREAMQETVAEFDRREAENQREAARALALMGHLAEFDATGIGPEAIPEAANALADFLTEIKKKDGEK